MRKFICLGLIVLCSACGGPKNNNPSTPNPEGPQPSIPKPSPAGPAMPAGEVTAQTYEVKDSLGKVLGWGYDLLLNGKPTIHQPMIPGVSGNHYFKTKGEAAQCAAFAADKMKRTGSLPTVNPGDLDSMHIGK